MRKQLTVTLLALLATAGAQAQTVIGNFEAGSLDGWVAQDVSTTFSFDTLGATVGSSSLKIVTGSGWHSVAKLDAMSLVPQLSQLGTTISLDLTLRNDNNSIPGWWMTSILILNSDATGWAELGTFTPSIPWGPTTTTLTWTIPDAQSALVASSTSYVELFLASNANAGGTTLNVDNIRINTVPEPATAALLGLGLAGFLVLRRRQP